MLAGAADERVHGGTELFRGIPKITHSLTLRSTDR